MSWNRKLAPGRTVVSSGGASVLKQWGYEKKGRKTQSQGVISWDSDVMAGLLRSRADGGPRVPSWQGNGSGDSRYG